MTTIDLSAPAAAAPAPTPRIRSGLWGRQLAHYPAGWRRLMYLGVTVTATISLYYLACANSGVITLQASECG